MNQTVTQEALQGYSEELFRRSIASTLELRRDQIRSMPEKRQMVEHILRTVIAIGTNSTLEEAANSLVAQNEARGTCFTYGDALKHANMVYKRFPFPVAGVERMLEMKKHQMGADTIWDLLRSRIPISTEYNDEWMEVADAWILRGERRLLDLGSREVIVGHIDDLEPSP